METAKGQAESKTIFEQIDPLFHPSSVAVIGASNNISKWGSFITSHILYGKFEGAIYPVHPKEPCILGLKAYPSLAAVPGPVDVAFLTVPASKVQGAIRDSIAKGVRGLVVITSGFSETGAEGRRMEQEAVALAREGGIRIIGPNTMGIINTSSKLYATGAPVNPIPGNISFISQSGNLGTQMLYWAEEQGIGISKFIGTGNEGDLDCTDILEYLGSDDETSVILLYMEGVDEGRRFLETASRVARKKPVIVLKTGRTAAGSQAAQSHTGALSGSREVFEGAFRQAGLIQAQNPSVLLDLACAFSYLPLPRGNRVGVFTLGGGWGVVTADECIENGLVLPELPPDLLEWLDGLLPPFWSRGNPIDLVGQMDYGIYLQILERMAACDRFDALITLGTLGAANFVARVTEMTSRFHPDLSPAAADELHKQMDREEMSFLADVHRLMWKHNKPIIGVSLSSQMRTAMHLENGTTAVVYQTPEKAVKVVSRLYEHYQNSRRRKPDGAVGNGPR